MFETVTVTLSSIPSNENVGNKLSWVDVDATGNNNLYAQLVYDVNAQNKYSTTNLLLSAILVTLGGDPSSFGL